MPVITNYEAKKLLQNENINDELLNMLIPIVQSAIINYCNNEFIHTTTTINGIVPIAYEYSASMFFQESDNSINDDVNGFTASNFKPNDVIRVYKSIHNDGFLTIKSITDSKIIIDSSYNKIFNENEEELVLFAKVKFPDSLKLISSQMLKFSLQKYGVIFQSEKIDDYSYSRGNSKLISGYPSDIMKSLDDYRSLYVKTIPMIGILLDRR